MPANADFHLEETVLDLLCMPHAKTTMPSIGPNTKVVGIAWWPVGSMVRSFDST
jgi:hypothetical protein